MSISSSSHLAPDDVARHSFGSVRRGFDPNEVRAYLESIAAGLRGVADREHQLLQELADAEHRASNPVLDEGTLTTALGTETARVLHSAHEVAAEMVAKSEAEANRLLTEAREEIEQTRSQTEDRLAEQSAASEEAAKELRERTNQQVASGLEIARRDADALLDRAREECRAMVDEAQGLRARVLADLSKRRKVLHAQIEQLRAGRERLAETVHDVRRAVDGIADELFAAEDNARLAAEAAGREALDRADEGSPEELAAQLLAEEQDADAAVDALAAEPEGPYDLEAVDALAGEPAGPYDLEAVEALEVKTAQVEEGVAEVEATTADAEDPDDADSDEVTSPEGAADASPVDALFAKIRAAHDGPEVADGEPAAVERPVADKAEQQSEAKDESEDRGDGPPEERNPLAIRRDELIDPIVTTLARRLKRTLQDTQNELLDSLRSNGSVWSSDLLVEEREHIDSYATAALPALEQAAAAGVSFAEVKGPGPKQDALIGIAHELAEAVTGPLRRRLSADEGLDGAEEAVVAEHVGSAFREWKGERIERLAGDYVVAAFSTGTISAVKGKKSAKLEWVAVSDSGDEPCPDCEDNGLNGSQPPGEDFPTGHHYPPAHPGCRCLLALSAT